MPAGPSSPSAASGAAGAAGEEASSPSPAPVSLQELDEASMREWQSLEAFAPNLFRPDASSGRPVELFRQEQAPHCRALMRDIETYFLPLQLPPRQCPSEFSGSRRMKMDRTAQGGAAKAGAAPCYGLQKPDRCHHCSLCNVCIMGMDHHCPWVGACVGAGNRKHFLLLLLHAVLALTVFLGFLLPELLQCFYSTVDLRRQFLLLFSWFLALGLDLLLTGFFCFHIYLLSSNMTTLEWCERVRLARDIRSVADLESRLYILACGGDVSGTAAEEERLEKAAASSFSANAPMIAGKSSSALSALLHRGQTPAAAAAAASPVIPVFSEEDGEVVMKAKPAPVAYPAEGGAATGGVDSGALQEGALSQAQQVLQKEYDSREEKSRSGKKKGTAITEAPARPLLDLLHMDLALLVALPDSLFHSLLTAQLHGEGSIYNTGSWLENVRQVMGHSMASWLLPTSAGLPAGPPYPVTQDFLQLRWRLQLRLLWRATHAEAALKVDYWWWYWQRNYFARQRAAQGKGATVAGERGVQVGPPLQTAVELLAMDLRQPFLARMARPAVGPAAPSQALGVVAAPAAPSPSSPPSSSPSDPERPPAMLSLSAENCVLKRGFGPQGLTAIASGFPYMEGPVPSIQYAQMARRKAEEHLAAESH